MSFHIYIGKNDEKPTSARFFHESEAHFSLGHALQQYYKKEDEHCILLLEPLSPMADIIILTSHGVGVLELKGHKGQIQCDNVSTTQWYVKAPQGRISNICGGKHHVNPYLQVRSYQKRIQKKITESPVFLRKIAHYPNIRQAQIQSAVCFTHEQADISALLKRFPLGDSHFSVLKRENWLNWVNSLRFGVTTNEEKRYQPLQISEKELIALCEDTFGAVEARAMTQRLMETTTWGILRQATPSNNGQIYSLNGTEFRIGRNPGNHLVIPSQLNTVSREHAVIRRAFGNTTIQLLGNTGTLHVNDKAVISNKSLHFGDIVSVGAKPDTQIRFVFESMPAPLKENTQPPLIPNVPPSSKAQNAQKTLDNEATPNYADKKPASIHQTFSKLQLADILFSGLVVISSLLAIGNQFQRKLKKVQKVRTTLKKKGK